MTQAAPSQSLGPDSARMGFYLPTAPELPPGWDYRQADAIDSLIALNGNHWRKIFTIMAKLCAPDEHWREYRRQLLKLDEQIIIGATRLSSRAQRHLISGAVSARQLGLEPTAPGQRVSVSAQVIVTPYLDYRQFPNQLVEQTRRWLRSGETDINFSQ